MRDFLNGILALLYAPYLTDIEFDSVVADIPTYNQQVYEDLARILGERELLSDIQDRLIALFKARGVDVVPMNTARSNIFIGAVL